MTRQFANLFPIVERQDARLLTGQSRFESWSGSGDVATSPSLQEML